MPPEAANAVCRQLAEPSRRLVFGAVRPPDPWSTSRSRGPVHRWSPGAAGLGRKVPNRNLEERSLALLNSPFGGGDQLSERLLATATARVRLTYAAVDGTFTRTSAASIKAAISPPRVLLALKITMGASLSVRANNRSQAARDGARGSDSPARTMIIERYGEQAIRNQLCTRRSRLELAWCPVGHRACNVLPPLNPTGAVTTYMSSPGADLISPAVYMVMRSLPSLSATHT